MVGRNLIPDASGPVAPASTGRTGGPKIIWAKQSSAPGMSFAPASHVQRALQSKPSAAPNPQRDDPVAGFFRKIGEFFSPNKPRPERGLLFYGVCCFALHPVGRLAESGVLRARYLGYSDS